ncbi:iron-sulfur cluster assembly scaffold protein [Photorhabdus sp. RM323S]|uniref:iron-sulfur cluster assembly scaffold protein n=1 Tax=Photorhabdus sp. RM323S TaxID=3342828 RepID=UPI0036D92189
MFNNIIIDNFCNPDCQGTLSSPSIKLALGNPVCGDKVDIDLTLDRQGRVNNACFRAWGCTASLAMSNQFCRHVKGKTLEELNALSSEGINALLGELEPAQQHCLGMLHKLFEQLKGKI